MAKQARKPTTAPRAISTTARPATPPSKTATADLIDDIVKAIGDMRKAENELKRLRAIVEPRVLPGTPPTEAVRVAGRTTAGVQWTKAADVKSLDLAEIAADVGERRALLCAKPNVSLAETELTTAEQARLIHVDVAAGARRLLVATS